jgi:FkbM family methyltransferase
MAQQRAARIQNLATKALRAIPEVILHPAQVLHASRGVHWATLNMLDVPWVRDLDITAILDVGANTGQFASAARVIFPNTRIYSFEPIEECFSQLRQKMDRDPMFKAFNVALGDRVGEAAFHRSSFSESSSLLPMANGHREAFPWTGHETEESVVVTTLDSLLPELEIGDHGLLKIDVQGSERAVLEGAKETLKQVEISIIEVSFTKLYEGESEFREINRLMNEQGFEFSGLLDQLLHPRTAKILQGDAVFLRKHPTDK